MIRAAFATAAFTCAVALRAHPDIAEALGRLNEQIAAAPTNADLYLERGELYAQHEEWIAAEANYLRAAEIAPTLPAVARARGALALATGQLREALKHLDVAVAADPTDAEALVLRGRAYAALKNNVAALTDYDTALRHIAAPTPELFLQRAALYPTPMAAVRSLDQGIATLGSVVTLELRALTLEESAGKIDAALVRIDRLAGQSERAETWLKRRGDLLVRAGRRSEARTAYAAAVTAISTLPDWLQQSPDTARLLRELRQLTPSDS